VPVLRAAVAEFVLAAGVRDDHLDAVKLADADEPGDVHVATWMREGTVYVSVRDDGIGMMPRLDSPGLGVGLPFIADTADTLDIASGEGGGTELRMTFRVAAA
jgi:nitrate/nitrite-specific signal transduction histidine kinase